MELLIEETVEPSFVYPRVIKPVRAAAQPSLLKRLEESRGGRAVLGFLRWGVVCSLVLTGFFGAELVSSGIDLASQSNVAAASSDTPQPVLASADLNPRH